MGPGDLLPTEPEGPLPHCHAEKTTKGSSGVQEGGALVSDVCVTPARRRLQVRSLEKQAHHQECRSPFIKPALLRGVSLTGVGGNSIAEGELTLQAPTRPPRNVGEATRADPDCKPPEVRIVTHTLKYLKNLTRTSHESDSDGKQSACNAREPGRIARSGRSPGEANGNPTLGFLPGESLG